MRSSNGAIRPSDRGGADLATLVRQAWREQRLLRRLAALYRRLDRSADTQGAKCMGGGCCCRFDLAGHRLYLSTGELALLAMDRPLHPQRTSRMRCPYQQGPRCQARDRRPLGCRTYFCKGSQRQSQQQYEHYHRVIRRLHDRAGLEYRYVELTAALAELEDSGQRP